MPHGRNVRSESSVVGSAPLNDHEESPSPAADSFARLRAGRNGAEELENSVDGCAWTLSRFAGNDREAIMRRTNDRGSVVNGARPISLVFSLGSRIPRDAADAPRPDRA